MKHYCRFWVTKVPLWKYKIMSIEDNLPKVRIDDPIGESLPADPDSLEDTVAGQLVHHEERINHTGLLHAIR